MPLALCLSFSLSVSHSLFLSIFRSLATISNLEGNGKETEEGFIRELYYPSWNYIYVSVCQLPLLVIRKVFLPPKCE